MVRLWELTGAEAVFLGAAGAISPNCIPLAAIIAAI
jgi:hypothetical protein